MIDEATIDVDDGKYILVLKGDFVDVATAYLDGVEHLRLRVTPEVLNNLATEIRTKVSDAGH